MTSDRGPKEHEEFLEELRKNTSVFRQAIDNTVSEFEKLLTEYDPLQVISGISKITLVKDPETYAESAEIYSEALVEYLVSLALSKPYPTTREVPPSATTDRILGLWNGLRTNMETFYLTELADKTIDPTEAQLRAHLLISYLFVRGQGYAAHLEQTFLELFESHNQHLSDTIGFSAREAHAFMRRAEERINSALNEERQKLGTIRRAHARFNEWIETNHLENRPFEDVRRQFTEENPDIAKDMAELKSYLASLRVDEAFEVRPESETERKILKTLSCEFGDNEAFLTQFPKWRGWPTNDTIISSRPIVKVNDRYYILHPPMAFRSLTSVMENLLEQDSPDYYRNTYLPSRDRYLEKIAVRLVKTLLPGSCAYSRLYYLIQERGKAVRYELDGLVMHDDCLVIVEAKASRLPPEKRRGAIRGLEDSMKGILTKAQGQATRAIRYINSAPVVTFSDEKEVPTVSVERQRFRHVFIILVSLEPIYELSCHLPTARRLGLLPEREWPWFVHLNDLRVISEVVEHPSTFLHYLKRRIALNDQPAVHALDELDYFMYYIKTGLFFDETGLQQVGMLALTSCTDELDAYYSYLRGERSAAAKPRIKMPPVFEQLISRLETEMPHHFISTCLHLLDSDDETRSVIAGGIENCEKRLKGDDTARSISLRIDKVGILLYCMRNLSNKGRLIARLGSRWLNKMNVDEVSAICWSPPFATGEIRTFFFSKDGS